MHPRAELAKWPQHFDLVLAGKGVRTFATARDDSHRHRIIAVRDGQIVRLATRWADVAEFVGPSTRVVAADDMVFAPGLVDSHNHVMTAVRDLYAVPLDRCGSIADIQMQLRRAASDLPDGRWLASARAWTVDQLHERRLPDRHELDVAVPDHEVCLRPGAHCVVLNSQALRAVGIGRETPDPPGGTIARDAVGQPTGHLLEYAAFARVLPYLAEPTQDELCSGLRAIHRRYNAAGITAVRNAGIRTDELLTYQRLRDESGLTLRTSALIRVDPTWPVDRQLDYVRSWQLASGFGDDLLRIEGVKLFLDGGDQAAAVGRDPAGRIGRAAVGHVFGSPESFAQIVSLCGERRLQVSVHAVGDIAVDVAIDGYRRSLAGNRRRTPSLTIEHAWLVNDDQCVQLAVLHVAVSTQYANFYMQGDGSMERYWGRDRVERAVPLRSLLDAGVTVALGSDWNTTPASSVQPFDPMMTLLTAVSRRVASGRVRGPDQRIRPSEAYRLHSVNSAQVSGDAQRRGPLTVGRFADITGFHGDPLAQLAAGECPKVALTVAGGKVVFSGQQVR